MPGLTSRHGCPAIYSFVFIIISLFLVPVDTSAQGNGRASTGTGGIHSIQGYIFFPSGRRAEGSIVVKLQPMHAGEITVLPDSSGAFTFSNLAPDNYTVVVNAGNDYEIARDSVYIDADPDLSRSGARLPPNPRRYTVMIHLQPKPGAATAKPGVLDAALAEVPEKARKLYDKALEQSRAGETEKAIDSLKEAISIYPKFPLALNELGVQYLKLGQTEKALDVLRTAVKLNPDGPGPKLNLGIALLERKQLAEAEDQLRGALKLNSSMPTGHMYLGICLIRRNNLDDAEKELLSAIQGSGNQLGLAQYYLGGIYWKKEDFPRAVTALEEYLRLTPNSPDAERVRGTIKTLRGRTPQTSNQ
jgi:Flp pilus assembly protein TadD